MLKGQIEGAAWGGPVMVERVFRRRGEGVLPWRYRAVLRNSGPAAVLALQVNLHPPFRPSAEVLGQRLLVLAGGERRQVEFGILRGEPFEADRGRAVLRLRGA